MGKALLAVAAAALLVATACADGAEPAAKHPYMPASLEVPGYVENTLTYATILGVFGVGVAAAIGASLWASRNAKLSALDTATVTWFVCSGLIHLILEGHFAVYNRDLVTRMDFLSQLWKEYGKGDSRYMFSDTFVVPMETCTAFIEGPLCLLTAIAILRGLPWRHATQLIVSLGQLYGCVLYFATEELSPEPHCYVGHPLYYWFYYVFMNSLWILIPGLLVLQSTSTITEQARRISAMEAENKGK